MTRPVQRAALAPFRVASFRFQWPADLATSWAFEMETLILGWYVLVETGSVLWLTVFVSLQFLGTLIAPMFGVVGDRLGRRTLLCAMRAAYAVLAGALLVLSVAEALRPHHVFLIAFFAGLVRPSDLVMRNALIADTMPADRLMSAMGISRTTMDTARIAGALIGAGLFSQFGMSTAYGVVVCFYLASLALTFGVSGARPGQSEPGSESVVASPWQDLRDGLAYVARTPVVLAVMWLAFLINITAYPMSHGLLPYVAREIYLTDENGLAHLVAAFAVGALGGSLTMIFAGGWRYPARVMLISLWLWYAVLLAFGQMEDKIPGLVLLFAIGYLQSMAMIAMSVTLIGATEVAFRGRVMGARMLAVYGLPLGLMASSAFVDRLGFAGAVSAYGTVGLLASLAIAAKWRRVIWHDR